MSSRGRRDRQSDLVKRLVKEESRRGRRHIDRDVERRAREGDEDIPSSTPNREVSDPWQWD